MNSVARPSSAGLRSAFSEGNLSNANMFDDDGYGDTAFYGSVPWLHDNSSTKHNAKTNKYLQSTSSIFDDPRLRENIRHERGRQALDELKQQVADREAAKRREREEEERIFAAMNAPTTYNPSFQEPDAPKRSQGPRLAPSIDTSATVQSTGGGYFGGGYGGGYDIGGGFGGTGGGFGGGGYNPSPNFDAYNAEPSYPTPTFFGGRKPQRFNANMTSEERAFVNRDRATEVQNELQWQIQMKKKLDEERKKKEALEDKLMEESVKQQQERMKKEYESEMEKKRKREEEQTRRRDAQLRHIEMIQAQAQSEKNAKMARARAAAEEAASAQPRQSTHDDREIKSQKTPKTKTPPREEVKTKQNKRNPRGDDDFGLNLKSDSRFLAAQQPNKFFDSPNTPIKMPRTSEDRKRPKPMPEDPFSEPRRNYRANIPTTSRGVIPRVKTTPPSPPPSNDETPPAELEASLETETLPDRQTDSKSGHTSRESPAPLPSTATEAQTDIAEKHDIEIQTTLALERWESQRKKDENRATTYVKGKPFNWSVHPDGLSQEEKKKLSEMSEEEIKKFEENNQDLMSQLKALKTNLKPSTGSNETFNPGGQSSSSQSGTQRNKSRNSRNSGYEPSSPQAPTRSSRSGVAAQSPQDQPSEEDEATEDEPTNSPPNTRGTKSGSAGSQDNGEYPSDLPTIPAGRLEDVDYMRIPTGGSNPPHTPGTADKEVLERGYGILPDDTSRTTLKKFLKNSKKEK
ncbi:hypothetical protein SK128_005366 [Halocaridina rubra]|uniref:CCDC66 domain-containing protein n=1 Tax=Halocaridina rubra TaxID=373956 RepID=A0AAN8X2F3_HALRR